MPFVFCVLQYKTYNDVFKYIENKYIKKCILNSWNSRLYENAFLIPSSTNINLNQKSIVYFTQNIILYTHQMMKIKYK